MVADDNDAIWKRQKVVGVIVVDVRQTTGQLDAPFSYVCLVQTIQLLAVLGKHDFLYWLKALFAIFSQFKHSLKILHPQRVNFTVREANQ